MPMPCPWLECSFDEAVLRDDPDFAAEIERWSTYIGQGAIRFYLPPSPPPSPR